MSNEPSQDRDALAGALRTGARRMRAERALDHAVKAALAAHAVLLPWLVLAPSEPVRYLLLAGGAAAAGWLVGMLRPMPPMRVARRLDARLRLHERLQSAIEFAGESDRPVVRSLLADAAASVARAPVREALPIRPPRTTWTLAVAAVLAGAALWWGAGLEPADAQAALEQPTARVEQTERLAPPTDVPVAWVPEAERPEPGQWQEAAFKDSPALEEAESTKGFLRTGEHPLDLLDPDLELPELMPRNNDPGERVNVRAASTGQPTVFMAPRTTEEEVNNRLGELETMWGIPSTRDGDRIEIDGEDPEAAEEAAPANQPDGRRIADREASEEPTEGETSDLNEDTRERRAPPSDRFGSLPDRTDLRSADLPPWPKGSPDGGSDDAETQSKEGTGRTSGDPGIGYSTDTRGRRTDRIEGPDGDDMRLAGRMQNDRHDSYDSDLPGLRADLPATLEQREMRTRFTRQAEQSLTETWVPFASRLSVKRYFEAIEASQ